MEDNKTPPPEQENNKKQAPQMNGNDGKSKRL